MPRSHQSEATNPQSALQCNAGPEPETFFDDVVWLAATATKLPMAVVGLNDGKWYWFNATFSSRPLAVPLNSILVDRTLGQSDVFVVPNTLDVEDYGNDPLVQLEACVRYFVGVPLLAATKGPIGLLAVMDSKARRSPTNDQKRVLTTLARRVVAELEHRHRSTDQRQELDERFRFIAEGVEDLIAVLDVDGTRLYNNHSYHELFGNPVMLRGTDPFAQIHVEDRERVRTVFKRSVSTAKGERAEFRYVLQDGSIRYMESQGTPILDASGKVTQVVVITRDMTKRKSAEDAKQRHNLELEQRYSEISALNAMANLLHRCDTTADMKKAFAQYERKLFPTSSGAIYLFNPDLKQFEEFLAWGSIASCDAYFSKDDCWAIRSGSGFHVVEDPDPNTALLCTHVHDVRTPYVCIQMTGKVDTNIVVHLQMSSSKGESLHQEEQRRRMRAEQEVATAVGKHFALAIDKLAQREDLQKAAEEDELTGLFNRNYMETMLQREVLRSARNRKMLGIIMVDIDYFKVINDTHTHMGGDYALAEVGKFLKSHVRDTDIACRYGGEEFMLIMPEASDDGFRERAEQLRQGVKALNLVYGGKPLTLTLSLGGAFLVEHAMEVAYLRRADRTAANLAKDKAEELKRNADEALYQAKKEGRDRVVIWNRQTA